VSGRLKNNMHFVMLVPKSLDPVARGRKLPLPEPRPSEQIAKLFRQTGPAKEQATEQGAPASSSTVAQAASAGARVIPLPVPRPKIAPPPELTRQGAASQGSPRHDHPTR
jgi:membrane-bound lytic murein transglycosylase A